MTGAAVVDTTKMSTRGQVIIPKDIREYIGAVEDTIFTVMPIDKETIIMRKMDKKRLVAEFMAIRSRTGKISPK
ncbi:hypothetical protein HYU15_00995 [Candidatus Woesearchaeota archaeon]|nr:hypothetical protein [Candidatus Woesearchaeota archaeon]